jgi:hypothetical protein
MLIDNPLDTYPRLSDEVLRTSVGKNEETVP